MVTFWPKIGEGRIAGTVVDGSEAKGSVKLFVVFLFYLFLRLFLLYFYYDGFDASKFLKCTSSECVFRRQQNKKLKKQFYNW